MAVASKSQTGKFNNQRYDFPSARKLSYETTAAQRFNLKLPETAFKIGESGNTTQGNSSFDPISPGNLN